MDVTRLRRSFELEAVQDDWQLLAAGQPMRSWHWQTAWWTHYGHSTGRRNRRLFTLVVTDGSRVIAIAPWFIEQSAGRGCVIQFLGEEEVCSEYPTILCRPSDREQAAAALADYLTTEYTSWDALELTGVADDDLIVQGLVAHLAERGMSRFRREIAFRCWRLPLPESWEAYLSLLSKAHRKQLRRLQRNLSASGEVATHCVKDAADLEVGWQVLVDLHQRRWRSIGEPGCFASPRFAAFHESVTKSLIHEGQLRICWIEAAGEPIAAEYGLASADTTFAYQGGLDPAALAMQPGRISAIQQIQRAIEEGHHTYDFLRGDEPYKAHWRAAPVNAFTIRVVAERAPSKIRAAAWETVGNLRDWLKASWHRVSESAPGACAT